MIMETWRQGLCWFVNDDTYYGSSGPTMQFASSIDPYFLIGVARLGLGFARFGSPNC
jgi:hypothetical protein